MPNHHRRSLALRLAGTSVLMVTLQGATLRVDPLGGGDHTTIQDAVDAAAPGDTISVAPGEYRSSTVFEFDPGQTPGETFLGIATDSLTIIGDDRDSVFIGPSTPDFFGELPKGIASQYPNITKVEIRGVTIENARDGAYIQGTTVLGDVVFRSCGLAVVAGFTDGFVLENSQVEDSSITGAVTVGFSNNATIRSTRFERNWSKSVSVLNNSTVNVEECEFLDGGGLQYFGGSSGTVTECRFENLHSTAVGALGNAHIVLESSRMTSTQTSNIAVDGISSLIARRNVLISTAPTAPNIRLSGVPTVTMNHNDIHLAPGFTVFLDGYPNEGPTVLDFTNNYWTTTDEAILSEEIWDGNDNKSINATVDFLPLRHTTTPLKRTSFGQLRSQYK